MAQKYVTLGPMWVRLLCLCLLFASETLEAASPQWSTFAGGEGAGQENAPGHAFYGLKYTNELTAHGQVSAELNTETLRLEWSQIPLVGSYTLGTRLTGELGFANLMPDYFLDGVRTTERGFFSSYLQAQAWIKGEVLPKTWATIELGGRRWFAQTTHQTHSAFVLPSETVSIEPRFHLTWWRLHHDAGWSDPHRLFPRIAGFAMGLSLGLDWFADTSPWGAIDPEAFTLPDNRNRPEATQWLAYQWMRAGRRLGSSFRIEVEQVAAYQTGADDRTRWLVGGLNPYVIPLAGSFWGYFHTRSFVSSGLTLRHTLNGNLEMGPLVNAVNFVDPGRRGRDHRRTFWGAGLVVDWRSGPWQVDVRGGYSPTLDDFAPRTRPWSIFFAVGWGE